MSKKRRKTKQSRLLQTTDDLSCHFISPLLSILGKTNQFKVEGGRQDWYICGCGSSGSTRPENIIPEMVEKNAGNSKLILKMIEKMMTH
jgi:hypothetical protein